MKRILSVLLMSMAVSASDIAVLPVTVTNLTPSQGDAIGAVMAMQLSKASKKSVIGPVQTRTAFEADSSDIIAVADRLGVSECVRMTAVALESKILVEAVLYSRTGEMLYQVQMTAASLDDISEVCDRMALALVERVNTDMTMNLDNITKTEVKESNRLFTDKITGVKCGMVFPMAKGARFEPMMITGFDMRLDSKDFFFEFGAMPMIPANGLFNKEKESYGGIHIELGGSRYLLRQNISPYIGGGISPRYLLYPSTITAVPYVQAGMMMMRFSSTRIYCDLRISQHVLPIVYEDSSYDPVTYQYKTEQTGKYYPTEVGLNVGIGW